MNFTIFTPTRGRVNLLDQLLTKLEENTKYHNKIEVLFWVDSDDFETQDFLYQKSQGYSFELRYYVKDRPKSLNEAINFLASQAKGKYLFNINDDCQIVTKDWDEIVISKIIYFKAFSKIKDDIIYCKTGDNSVDRNAEAGYASFPIISKQAVETLGFFMRQEFVGLGADTHVYRIYKAIDRVIDCSEVQLDHVYHSSIFAVNAPDETAWNMRQKSWANPVDPHTFEIESDVEKLKSFIFKCQIVDFET